MTKRYHKRHSKGGGFFDSIKQSFNSLSSSVQNSASGMWNKTKKPTTSYQPTTPSYNTSYQGPSNQPSYGGRRTRRRMKGGYRDSISMNGIAASASPVHGLQTARAHNWVGGRRRKRKTRRTRRYK
jgi:hypothetical protein